MKNLKYTGLLLLLLCFSCDEGGVLFETDISDQNVQLLSPTEGSTVENITVNFDWEALEDATAYDIQIAQPNFANAAQLIVNERVDSTTTFQKVLQNNTYQWRVRAINSGYETPYSTAGFRVNSDDGFSE